MGKEVQRQENLDAVGLKEIHRQLEWLADQTTDYPVECSVGEYDLLFDTRDDIELLLEHLDSEIPDDPRH